MASFSFLSTYGTLSLNTTYQMLEQDLIFAQGVSGYELDQVTTFDYGLKSITLNLVSGTAPNRVYDFNLGTENLGGFIKFDYSLSEIVGVNTEHVYSTMTIEDCVDGAPTPQQFASNLTKNFEFNLQAYLGGSELTPGQTYQINEVDMLAGYSDDQGNTLVVSEYGNGAIAGVPKVVGVGTAPAVSISTASGSPGSRVFDLVASDEDFSFYFTVSNYLDNPSNTYYTETNGVEFSTIQVN